MQSKVERDRREVWRDSPLYIYLGPDHAWATASSNLTEADRGRVMKVLQRSAAWSCDVVGPPSPAQCIGTPSDADMTDGADSRSSTVADGGQSCRIQHCFPMACRGADAGFCQVRIALHRFNSEVDCRPGRSQPPGHLPCGTLGDRAVQRGRERDHRVAQSRRRDDSGVAV
jgi:hypothetical protein